MKKIQIVYNEFPPIAKHLAVAFGTRGYLVDVFYGTQYVHWFYRYVIRVLSRWARILRLIPKGQELWSNHPLNFYNYIDHQFQRRFAQFKPDYLLVIHGLPFSHSFISNLTIPKVAWWVEPNDELMELNKNAIPFDIYTSFSVTSMEKLRQHQFRSEYICHAVCPREFYPLPIQKDIDVVFVGNWSEWRDDVMEAVLSVTTSVMIYGPQWPKKSRIDRRTLDRVYGGDMLVGEPLNTLFNRAKVVLNASRIYGSAGLNMRFFEVLATQSLLITDVVREIDHHFVDGKDLLVYKSINEMISLIQMALKNESLRIEIAKHGYDTVIGNYTYDHLASQFEKFFHELT